MRVKGRRAEMFTIDPSIGIRTLLLVSGRLSLDDASCKVEQHPFHFVYD